MKKLESSLLNMVLVLVGVALIMGGILAGVNHITEGPIAEQLWRLRFPWLWRYGRRTG